jgi:CRP-like cAMP-binding protein
MSLQSANHLLLSLPSAELDAMQPHLEQVAMPVRMVLETPHQAVTHVYFPLGGIISVVAMSKGHEIEVGIIGHDGMTGLPVLLGDSVAAHKVFVQIAGEGLRMTAEQFRLQVESSPAMLQRFLSYAHAFSVQTAHTALANGRGNIGARLARSLLMSTDRTGETNLPFTHEFLSLMLGVRRAGVSEALASLASQGLLAYTRGEILVLDRPGLEKLANGLYGVPEAEQQRLTGWRSKAATGP